VRDELIKQDALDNLYLRIRDDKIVARLLEKAKVTEVEAPGKPEGEAADKKKKSTGKAKAAESEDVGGEKAEDKPAKPKRTPPKRKKKSADDSETT